jgi:hypothetical protein
VTPTHRTTRDIELYKHGTLPAGTPVEVRVWRVGLVLGWRSPTAAVSLDSADLEPIPPREEPAL